MTFAMARLMPVYRRNTYEEVLNDVFAGAASFHLPMNETGGLIAKNARYNLGPGADVFGGQGAFSAAGDWSPDAQWAISGGVATYTDGSNGSLTFGPDLGVAAGDTYRLGYTADSAGNIHFVLRNSGGNDLYVHNAVAATVLTDFISAFPAGASTLIRAFAATTVGNFTLDNLTLRKIGELDAGYNGPTLAATTCMGQPAPTFDGVNDSAQLEHNRLESLVKPENGDFAMTFIGAIRLSQTQWTNSTAYYAMSMGVDANNLFAFLNGGDNSLIFRHYYGGTPINCVYVPTAGDYDKWLHVIGTINNAENRARLYVKGQLVDSDTESAGTWTASALTAAFCKLGSISASGFWPNALAQFACANKEITATEAQQLYNAFRAQEVNAA